MRGRFGRLSTIAWFFAGVATVVAVLAVAGVVAAALGSPPAQQPPQSAPPFVTPLAYTSTLPIFPAGVNSIPPATPPAFWGPKEYKPTTGPSTAGARITTNAKTGRTTQLPPNIYVSGLIKEGDIIEPNPQFCPCFPPDNGVILSILGGKSFLVVSEDKIWDPMISPDEEYAFAWLYQDLGVVRGSESWSISIVPTHW